MTTEGHIEALERRHRELDQQIQNEMQRSTYDEMLVTALKRKKLGIKDELTRAKNHSAMAH